MGKIIAHHAKLLAAEVDELWLGGFSTGGNLVTSHAFSDDNVDGLLLFSPGFYPDTRYLFRPGHCLFMGLARHR
ncbi:hypothetical protein HSBAA_11980 [Vreelandella sulfidaeris]|uniref:Serine aminopeptidase S33 domain-containing protein n=1 Tax=Vreelandella sulfidaeris TaxID=115553 RepID=A0A455U1M7_9GAMM|nr:hypothetical protein HSBAA_11980 [Halomonas sulfidaeris]